jgi:UDP-N-acetylmuramoyl-L-alanyl-D-glutamate--2,6-diaminopimelate ligase
MSVPGETIVSGLESLARVPGRLEPVTAEGSSGPRVLVDFAHTPEALERVLSGLRPLVRGKLVVVFGCGGDRDRGKRPLMARAVERHADLCIVTSDNPRSEDPAEIARQVVAGFEKGAYHVELDRRRAIFEAVDGAREEDLVLVAGKGHETGQVLSDRTVPFDDVSVAADALFHV